MSENRAKRTERRQRFLRHRRLAEWRRGVSPVVATLILVLIAVAAAAALYIWLIGWQGGVTSTIGKPTVNQGTFTIGGSTSVYPFDQLAVTQFEQNNSGVSISNNQGGTGAGMTAVCAGAVDVGAASTPETAAGLITNNGCPSSDASSITITTIAYDAVDVVVQGANTHGLQSINYDTLTAIYDRASTTPPTLVSTTFNGVVINAGIVGALIWNEIPAAVSGVTIATVLQQPAAGYAALGGAGQAAGTGALANDIVTPAADDSPCGWTICAGPFAGLASNAAITPVERSDASGTTQTFEAKLLGATSSTAFATTFAGLGYAGCGGNNLLSDCGISVATQESGNPNVLSFVAGNANAIGYASDGLARTTAGVGAAGIIPFDAVGQQGNLGAYTSVVNGAVLPTTGSSGTISAGIKDSTTVANYAGTRPFELVTLAPPVGLVQQFLTFVLDPSNNQLLATESFEVSVYSV